MSPKYIRKDRVRRIIAKAKESGRVFSVTFVKRSNGELRQMLCRGRVKLSSKRASGERSYEPSDYDLTVVYDMQKHGFRSIPLDSVVQIKANGEVY